MFLTVLRQSVCADRGLGTSHFYTSPGKSERAERERDREREFCLKQIFTRAVLFFSSPAKTTGRCQVQCKWEYTYRWRKGEGEVEREKERGGEERRRGV